MTGLPSQCCQDQSGRKQKCHDAEADLSEMWTLELCLALLRGERAGILPVLAADGAIVEAGRFYYLNSIREICAGFLVRKSGRIKVAFEFTLIDTALRRYHRRL